jgi:acetate CoA/acetoacetate CoA-transferase beta subunit
MEADRMDKEKIKGFIAARAARELADGDVVNLGVGMPTLIPQYLPAGVKLILQCENGIIDSIKPSAEEAEPEFAVDAGGQSALAAPGGAYIDSSVSFGLIRGGHVDCTILGALEVDEKGNLANWIIPGSKVPGMGGAMDLVVGAKKVIITMEHTARGKAKILKQCRLPLTAAGCVNLIITEMGVIEVSKDGLVLTEINPEYTFEDVQKATEATLKISESLKEMA